MRTFFCIALLMLSFSAFSVEEEKRLMVLPFRVMSDTLNPQFTNNEAQFNMQVMNEEFQMTPFAVRMQTSVNGVWKEVVLDDSGKFNYHVEPGTYEFQIYANENFMEIKSQKVDIRPGHVVSVQLRFIDNYRYGRGMQIEVDKPVIYFHTSEEREFELTVNPAAPFSFVYPEMNGAWKGIAQPNGDISVNGVDYPYLFWESKQEYSFKSEGNGYKVEKDEVIEFLSKKLTELGLNQKEQADFITYWGPKMTENGTSFVQFSIDENCNQFATMNCTPAPQSVRRIYIQLATWNPYFENFLNDQEFTAPEATDWSILEWGGFSFSIPDLCLYDE